MYWLNCRAGWQPRVGYERPASAPPPFVVAKEEGVQQP
jgi:hypothetical protein